MSSTGWPKRLFSRLLGHHTASSPSTPVNDPSQWFLRAHLLWVPSLSFRVQASFLAPIPLLCPHLWMILPSPIGVRHHLCANDSRLELQLSVSSSLPDTPKRHLKCMLSKMELLVTTCPPRGFLVSGNATIFENPKIILYCSFSSHLPSPLPIPLESFCFSPLHLTTLQFTWPLSQACSSLPNTVVPASICFHLPHSSQSVLLKKYMRLSDPFV